MTDSDLVLDAIYRAIDGLNRERDPGSRLRKSPDTELFGRDGQLDSLGLVTLIVAVEEDVATETGLAITIASERAMSQSRSPFRTVGSLRDFVTVLVEEARRGA